MSQNSTYKSSTGTSKFKSKPLILSGERFFLNFKEPNFWGLSKNLIHDIILQLLLHMLYCILICVYIVFCRMKYVSFLIAK
jgi:hypothetical protein